MTLLRTLRVSYVKQKKTKQCLILIFAVTWICFALRILYPVETESTLRNVTSRGQNVTVNSWHSSYLSNEAQLSNKTFRHRESIETDTMIRYDYTRTSDFKSNESQFENINTTKIMPLLKYYRNDETNKTKLVKDKYLNIKSSKKIEDMPPFPLYPLFQSIVEMEFPTSSRHSPRIPHIIHQMYADEMIPEMYINHVKSFIEHNPTWQYRFWTDDSGRKLLEKHHPYLLKVYDKFGRSVRRSDLLRYAVLYEYGGFYADLDMENLRPLNITTVKYACIIPVEPFENSVFHYNMDFIMSNAVMSCRAKHPFFKTLLWNLQWNSLNTDPVDTTGPKYLTRMFRKYNHIGIEDAKRNKSDWSSNSPYFYKGELKEIDNNAVYVPNGQYFMDMFNPLNIEENGKFSRLCKRYEKLSTLQQRACSELYSRRAVRETQRYTFTIHLWYHLWLMSKSTINALKKINITKVVPNCIFYDDKI